MVSLVIFIFGLVVGSFLNAFIYRLEVHDGLMLHPRGRKDLMYELLKGRSQCPSCAHTLAWQDLIPLLSFALLKGECRQCKGKISFQYPLVELVTGLLFVAVLWFVLPKSDLVIPSLAELNFVQIFELFYLWGIVLFLMVIFVYDLKHFLIPDKVLYPAIGLVLLWQIFLHFQIAENLISLSFLPALLAGLGAAGFFLAMYVFSKGQAMGFGDVKLALFMGLFLSWPNILVAMSLAFAAGAIVGLALIFFKRKTMRSEVPFGPFLILGTFVALFWGERAMDWYLAFLGV